MNTQNYINKLAAQWGSFIPEDKWSAEKRRKPGTRTSNMNSVDSSTKDSILEQVRNRQNADLNTSSGAGSAMPHNPKTTGASGTTGHQKVIDETKNLFSGLKNWVKNNKLTAGVAGVGLVGAGAYLLSRNKEN